MAEFVWRRLVTADDSDAIESLRRGFWRAVPSCVR